MSVLKTLYDTYEYCEKLGFVDKHQQNEIILLPVFHSNIRSTGDNIINIRIDKDSNLIGAEFLAENSYVIFPVTIDSGSRTSSPCPHPLIDQICYVFKGNEKKHNLYLEALTDFYDNLVDLEVKDYLKIIKRFLEKEDVLKKVLDSCFGFEKYSKTDIFEIKITNDNGKTKVIDLEKIFVDFTVVDFKDGRNYEISEYVKLHDEYIGYVKSKINPNGICNISGEEDNIVEKHRGLMGNAKIISVSNKKETYFGRFKTGSDIIHVGYETSEKIHLMLKYFLENESSHIKIGENQIFINWFDNDISNSKGFNPTEKNESYDCDDESFVTDDNKDVSKSFFTGVEKFDSSNSYYTMIIDKSSNGRIAIKYYNKLEQSKLYKNLVLWDTKYNWERYNFNEKKFMDYTPSFKEILLAAYGVEQKEWLKIENESFKKEQYQKIIVNMLEGENLPLNIKKALEKNIRQRRKYKKRWNTVFNTALAVLSEDRKECKNMISLEEQSRSYLYGRLLAIYEKIERDAFDNDFERFTNAERFWSAYMNRPATIMKTLEQKIPPYCKKLKTDGKTGILKNMEKEKEEIMNAICTESKDIVLIDEPLDYYFAFGYYAERKFLYAKKEDK